jgi:SNF2 family DNA or RNA helicase
MPHQLEPALAVVRGLGCRVLLSDEVGLGKTIQAGLIAAELLERRAAERLLILTPAGLRDQWAEELEDRFGLSADVMDFPALRRRSATLPVGLNPWSTLAIAIAGADPFQKCPFLGRNSLQTDPVRDRK